METRGIYENKPSSDARNSVSELEKQINKSSLKIMETKSPIALKESNIMIDDYDDNLNTLSERDYNR